MLHSPKSLMKYRSDIDGLRAVAVIAVIAYHAHLLGFRGGFVGVDVFFVISGFLITRLLVHEFETKGRISFLDFYSRRIKRLWPALVTTLVGVIAIQSILVPSFIDSRKFAASVRWSLFGLANLFFHRNTGGYFDGATEEMPFLHLWSLGVEEQFYLFWPLFICLAQFTFRKARRTRWLALCLITITISFFCSWKKIHQGGSSEAFYGMPYRAWELGVGSLLTFMPHHRISRFLTFPGIILILTSVFTFSSSTVFPGPSALIPVLGTALIIWGGEYPQKNFTFSILSYRPIVKLGTLSYGWYLWHWPLLVIARLLSLGNEPRLTWRMAAVFISLLLAELSLRFIETPIRKGTHFGSVLGRIKPAQIIAIGMAFSALLCAASFGIIPMQDYFLSKKFGDNTVQMLREKTSLDGHCFNLEDIGSPECTLSFAQSPHSPLVAIWGDSHASSFFAMIEKYGRDHQIQVSLYSQGQTPALLENSFSVELLKDLKKKVQHISPAPLSLVLSSRWVSYTGKKLQLFETFTFPNFGSEQESLNHIEKYLTKTLNTLGEIGIHRILIILPYLEFEFPTTRCLQVHQSSCFIARSEFESYRDNVVQVIRRAASQFPNVRLIDPLPAICEDKSCHQLFHGIPVVIDSNHPSVKAAQLVGERYLRDLDWLIEK